MPHRVPEDMPDRMLEDMPDRMPEGMPDRMPDRMSARMPEDMPDRVPECLPDRMPADLPDNMPEDMLDRMPDGMPEDLPDNMPEDMPDRMPDGMPEDMPEHLPEDMPEDMPEHLPEDMPEHLPEDMPGRMPEDMPDRMPDRMPENMSDRMPEDLPVTTCINVMVGITRSKVIVLAGYPKPQSVDFTSWLPLVAKDKKRTRTTQENSAQREQRLEHAKKRKIRKISGWNVFQRDRMQNQTFSQDDYKARVRELSAEWKRMPDEEKAAFQIEANYQQGLLDDLAQTPLPTKDHTDEKKENVWRNGAKKLSARRLELNTEAFSATPALELAFSICGQSLGNSDGVDSF